MDLGEAVDVNRHGGGLVLAQLLRSMLVDVPDDS